MAYFSHYYDVSHSFLQGDSSAQRKTPNKSWQRYSVDYSGESANLLKTFKNLSKDDELTSPSLIFPQKAINFILFSSMEPEFENLKILLCKLSFILILVKTLILIVSLKKNIRETSDSMKSVFYHISSKLIEKNDIHLKRQKKMLGTYFIYKLKKWAIISKRSGTKQLKESFLLSYENEQIVCKICAKSVFAKVIKEHSALCLKMTETRLDIKKTAEHINNEIMANLMKNRRTVHIQNIIMKFYLTRKKIINHIFLGTK